MYESFGVGESVIRHALRKAKNPEKVFGRIENSILGCVVCKRGSGAREKSLEIFILEQYLNIDRFGFVKCNDYSNYVSFGIISAIDDFYYLILK